MKLPAAVLMVAISVGLAGCFSSNPSESDAKEVVFRAYKQYIDSGDLVVENVKKTDGKEMEMMGVKVYEMEVEVTRKFPKGINCVPKANDLKSLADMMTGLCNQRLFNKSIASGTSDTISARVVFEKSEKGWRGRF